MVCNPIQNNELKNRMCQFEENCTQIEGVRVPHLKLSKQSRYDVIGVIFSKSEKKRIRYVMFNEKKMHNQLINCVLMTAVLYVYCRTRLGGRLSKHDDAGYLSRIK